MNESATMMQTDFLGRMVTKALGAGSAIAPRLPSLFEPVSGAEVVPAGEFAESAARPSTTRDADPERVPQEKPSSSMNEILPHNISRVEDAQPANDVRPMEAKREAREPQGSPALLGTPLAAAIVSLTSQDPAPRRNHARPADDTESAVEGKPALVAVGTAMLRETETGRAREPKRVDEQPGLDQNKRRRQSGALMPEPVAAMVTRTGLKPAMPLGRDLPPAEAGQDQPAPVINVTIGRVEVRAVQGAQTQPRVANAKPKTLSLDDYLKQRGGGR